MSILDEREPTLNEIDDFGPKGSKDKNRLVLIIIVAIVLFITLFMTLLQNL